MANEFDINNLDTWHLGNVPWNNLRGTQYENLLSAVPEQYRHTRTIDLPLVDFRTTYGETQQVQGNDGDFLTFCSGNKYYAYGICFENCPDGFDPYFFESDLSRQYYNFLTAGLYGYSYNGMCVRRPPPTTAAPTTTAPTTAAPTTAAPTTAAPTTVAPTTRPPTVRPTTRPPTVRPTTRPPTTRPPTTRPPTTRPPTPTRMNTYLGLTPDELIELNTIYEGINRNFTLKTIQQLHFFTDSNILAFNDYSTFLRNEVRSNRNISTKITNAIRYIDNMSIHNISIPYIEKSWLTRTQNEKFSGIEERIFYLISAYTYIRFNHFLSSSTLNTTNYQTFIRSQLNLVSDITIATNIINYMNEKINSERFQNVEKCENNDYAPLLILIILLLAVILCFKYKI